MSPNFNEEIWRFSPQYQNAFDEGYEAAKAEMAALLKNMHALSTTTATTDPILHKEDIKS